ncbi:MAG: tetratricopeptide repeat protein [Candidatus Omnitrophica bacterium]|nr:tetratricopeptide repeat protein [Candidatus Omnitrophota bacterium]
MRKYLSAEDPTPWRGRFVINRWANLPTMFDGNSEDGFRSACRMADRPVRGRWHACLVGRAGCVVAFSVLWVLVATCSMAFADSFQKRFFEANKHYTRGEYAKAASQYEALIRSGIRGGHIYYNLGNAYFKLGQKGKAIVNYLRAQKEMPQDGDVFTNLNFVTSLLEEAQVAETGPWYERVFLVARRSFSAGTWFILSLVFFFLICTLSGYCIFKPNLKNAGFVVGAVLSILWIGCLGFHLSSVVEARDSKLSVIIEPKADVRYSPSYSGAVAFELSEGMKVMALKKEGDWVQIRLAKDKSGWVPATSIEKV